MTIEKKIAVMILYNGKPAGRLTKESGRYRFSYEQEYANISGSRPVSITLPIRREPYESNTLFPVFINMLSEGVNKRIQCRMLKIDEDDYFSLLLATTKDDGIGAITTKQIDELS